MWFSVTETYQWSARTSSWFVIYWCWHIFCVENILEFQYWFWLFTDVNYFSCAKCSYHSQLMFMWFSVTETYQWSARTSSWFVIYWCWHIFCVENILEFQYWFWLFTDVDYFSCAKCSYHSQLMFMWFSVTETYQWSARTSSWFVIYWCWHIFCVENILEFHWFWLFTDVNYFSCENVLIILDWCLCDFLLLKHINEVHALHLFDYLLMLTIFHVQNVLIILNWCLCDFLLLKHINEVHALHLHLSFTDVDIFFVWKIF